MEKERELQAPLLDDYHLPRSDPLLALKDLRLASKAEGPLFEPLLDSQRFREVMFEHSRDCIPPPLSHRFWR